MQFNYSVIIPYRDKYDLLLKAVDSVPERDDIQIIIVDNSSECLPKEKVPRKIKTHIDYLTSSPKKGAGCARNMGLKQVDGKYILFLDADDYFTPDAFDAFDKYLEKGFDIVYFKTDSINLIDGTQSTRHHVINQHIDTYNHTGNDDILRYRYVNPIAKMIQFDFVKEGGFMFDEVKVSNDVWFSVTTGNAAKKITADESMVYMITAGENGSSLTRIRTKENWFIRYQVSVRVNKFLKSVGKYKYRTRLLGFLNVALKEFGVREYFHFLAYALKNRVGIF